MYIHFKLVHRVGDSFVSLLLLYHFCFWFLGSIYNLCIASIRGPYRLLFLHISSVLSQICICTYVYTFSIGSPSRWFLRKPTTLWLMHHPGHHTRPPVCILDTGEAQSGDVPQNAGTDTAASRRLPSWSRRLLPYIPWSFPDNRVQSTSESYCKVHVARTSWSFFPGCLEEFVPVTG